MSLLNRAARLLAVLVCFSLSAWTIGCGGPAADNGATSTTDSAAGSGSGSDGESGSTTGDGAGAGVEPPPMPDATADEGTEDGGNTETE